MKTVTVKAWRRPDYLERTLSALARCRGIGEWSVYLFVDGPYSESSLACVEVARTMSKFPARLLSYSSPENLGIVGNVRNSLRTVFSHGSDFNICLEDDALLAPDALELAEWYRQYEKRDDYMIFSLGNCNVDGWDRPNTLIENDGLASPWACCITPEKWDLLEPVYDCKKHEPHGPDWSYTFEAAQRGWWNMYPFLSRAYNIGQHGGVHTVPSEYHDELGFSVWSGDGTNPVPESITAPGIILADRTSPRIRKWMIPELEARGIPIPSEFRTGDNRD